jgi:hypothetical protein
MDFLETALFLIEKDKLNEKNRKRHIIYKKSPSIVLLKGIFLANFTRKSLRDNFRAIFSGYGIY